VVISVWQPERTTFRAAVRSMASDSGTTLGQCGCDIA
jgi:hypothetical protein